MYIPPPNRVDDSRTAFDFIHAHGFATVVTEKEGIPWASHLPVLLDEPQAGIPGAGSLRSHMARANEQWRHFDPAKEVLSIFHGPHAYITPSWYASKIAVPTWNYATVHVYGFPRLEEDPEVLLGIVNETTVKYEQGREKPWKMDLPAATLDSLLKAIVGFTISITRVEAKFKLGQNRTPEDRAGMLAGLEASPEPDARALAAFIQANPRPGPQPPR